MQETVGRAQLRSWVVRSWACRIPLYVLAGFDHETPYVKVLTAKLQGIPQALIDVVELELEAGSAAVDVDNQVDAATGQLTRTGSYRDEGRFRGE